MRKLASLNSVLNFIDKKVITSNKAVLNSLQAKSVEKWYALIEDKSSILTSCGSDQVIQKGTVLCCMKSGSDSILTVTDSSNVNIFYDIYIPQSVANDMIKEFHKEQVGRINKIMDDKRDYIASMIKI